VCARSASATCARTGPPLPLPRRPALSSPASGKGWFAFARISVFLR
jgi:hypothetical protein